MAEEELKFTRIASRNPEAEYLRGIGTYVGNGFETRYERDGGIVSIGNWCSIGQFVTVYCGGYHHTDWVTTSPIREDGQSTYSKGNVEIGSDVWIGDGAVIMSGIRIGIGAVVGARSVVTRDVPPYAVVGGNPARLIRYRMRFDQIDAMLRIRWWLWEEQEVRRNWEIFCQPDIDAFIARFDRKRAP